MSLLVLADATAESDRLATMFRVFLVAALFVAPFGALTIRRVLGERADRREPDGPADHGEGAAAEADPDDLAAVIAEIDGAAQRLEADGIAEVTVVIPAGPTLDGRPLDGSMAERLVADAVSQSGLVAERDRASNPTRLVLRHRS